MKRTTGGTASGEKDGQITNENGGNGPNPAAPRAAAEADVQKLREETADEIERLEEEIEELRSEKETLRAENEELRGTVQEFREVFAALDVTLASIVEDSGAWSSPEYDRNNPINDAADDQKLEEIENKMGG